MRAFLRLFVILVALFAAARASAQTPASDLQRAVDGARRQRTAGIALTFIGIGLSTVGCALALAGGLTAQEADGVWTQLILGGTVLAPLGVTVSATGIPLWATARVNF